MTLNIHPVSRRALTTLSVVLLGALWAPRVGAQAMPSGAQYQLYNDPCAISAQSLCAQIILKPSVQVRNLHPSVSRVILWCATKLSEPNNWASTSMNLNVLNRDASYTTAGGNQMRINILKTAFVPNQSLTVICELLLSRAATGADPTSATATVETQLAVASASAPLVPTTANWNVVGAGSTVKWTQTVTIPNATP